MKYRLLFYLLIGLLSFGLSGQSVSTDSLNNYFYQAVEEWGIPGFSVGIVKDGQVIYAKGFGKMNVDEEIRPDGKTMYATASNSKAPQAWFKHGTVKFNYDNNMKITGLDFDVPNDDIFFEELKPFRADP